MALLEFDTFHNPRIEDSTRRCTYQLSDGSYCRLLHREHNATPDTLGMTLAALSAHPSERVSRLAQDLANEFGLFDQQDWFVSTRAVITLRVENMPEDMAKPYFDDKAREQRLVQRLQDAVEDTDFYITIDVSDVEVEDENMYVLPDTEDDR